MTNSFGTNSVSLSLSLSVCVSLAGRFRAYRCVQFTGTNYASDSRDRRSTKKVIRETALEKAHGSLGDHESLARHRTFCTHTYEQNVLERTFCFLGWIREISLNVSLSVSLRVSLRWHGNDRRTFDEKIGVCNSPRSDRPIRVLTRAEDSVETRHGRSSSSCPGTRPWLQLLCLWKEQAEALKRSFPPPFLVRFPKRKTTTGKWLSVSNDL